MAPSFLATLTLSALAATTLAAPLLPRQDSPECVSGLYILVARGSNEDVTSGRTDEVAGLIQAEVPNSRTENINYPAAIIPSGDGSLSISDLYPASVAAGAGDVKNKIRNYVDTCGPDSQIALLGYSQGANAISDALAGGLLRPIPLSSSYRDNIKAITLFADPSFTRRQSFNAGSNNDRNGIFARLGPSLRRLNTYAAVTQSYCDVGDFFCATGGSLAVHSATVPSYAQAAADFVVEKVASGDET
ncbi:hypothetical protein MBLNU230_g7782t1 [Neophaeotheca triangularis]